MEVPVAGSGPGCPGPGYCNLSHPVQLADMAPIEAAQEGSQGEGAAVMSSGDAGGPDRHLSTIGIVYAGSAKLAEATRVIILSHAGFARMARRPTGRGFTDEMAAAGAGRALEGRISPALATRPWLEGGMRSGWYTMVASCSFSGTG